VPTATDVTPPPIYQFHVLLLRTSPGIWRRILITSDALVAQLHFALQISLGWSNTQPAYFQLHGEEFGYPQPRSSRAIIDARGVTLGDLRLRLKERFLYTYGLPATWRLQIRLEMLLPHDSHKSYPHCLAGARQAPPEYCVGPRHFMVLGQRYTPERVEQRLREITALGPAQQAQIEHQRDERRHLNYLLQTDCFARQAVNAALQQYAAGTYRWQQPEKEVGQCTSK
jgi:hypothetical protein